jgi:hypothetical protein
MMKWILNKLRMSCQYDNDLQTSGAGATVLAFGSVRGGARIALTTPKRHRQLTIAWGR